MLVLLLTFPGAGFSQDTIRWRVTDWPPGYITHGPYKNQGTFDSIIHFLSKRMPAYQHTTVEMTFKRLVAEMKKGANVCYVSATPKPFADMSVIDVIELPHKIFIRKDKWRYLENKEIVSLDQLLADRRLKAGVSFSRYSPTLNSILEQHRGQENVIDVPNYMNLIKMLFSGRIDYLIEYSSVINYYERTLNKEGIVTGIAIRETRDEPYLAGHVACPATEWGRTVIERVNRVLRRGRTSPAYMEGLLRWYEGRDRETMTAIYEKLFQK